MTLPTPPRYVVIPEDMIEQAYAPDKPRRALLASFVRILSLAWQSKYKETPRLNEAELMEFLKLRRRQYFEQRSDMELLGWLRSSHPVPGFVQFSFSRTIAHELEEGAENRTASAENCTDSSLLIIEEDHDLKLINSDHPQSSYEKQVRKIALPGNDPEPGSDEALMRLLVENLTVLFDPDVFGVLEWRPIFAVGIPDRAVAWIAKAYQDRVTLRNPIGFVVMKITNQEAPHRYFMNNWKNVLPAEYLEAVGLFEAECDYCTEKFPTRALKESHREDVHQNVCDECGNDHQSALALKEHWMAEHDPLRFQRRKEAEIIPLPELDGTIVTTWQAVLSTLQEDMPRASFDTWVRDTKPAEFTDNLLTVETKNAYARDWLNNRMTGKVNKILCDILRKPVSVRFVVANVLEILEDV